MKSSYFKPQRIVGLLLIMLFNLTLAAQFEVNGEILQRSEYRHGYGTLISQDSLPAVFIGSRTRLQAVYSKRNIKCFVSIQDVRTFGSVPSKVNEPFLSLYEGWIQVRLDSGLQLKIGRQELNYDNSRFFGNADWVLGGRSHDLILLKLDKGKVKADLGYAYNQDGEKISGNIYSKNNYKTAEFVRGEFSTTRFSLAAMIWNEGRQYVVLDTVGKVAKQGMRFMQTAGLPAVKLMIGKTTLSGFYYHQFGHDVSNIVINAYDCGLDLSHIFRINEAKEKRVLVGIGAEVISGTDKSSAGINNSFSLLYGTNHALNGYMDYFYVGGRHDKSVGLIDGYFKTKLDFNSKVFCLLNAHYFQSHSKIIDKFGNTLDPYLGSEIDLTFGIKLFEHFSIQAGYSQMFASGTLLYFRNMTYVSDSQNWAYLMLLYRPNGKKPFVGISY